MVSQLLWHDVITLNNSDIMWKYLPFGPRQANLVLIAYASSEGSGEPAHPCNLARTSAARSYKQWVKRNLQTESQISGPSEWLGMRSYNLSWRNARRHKFAWRGSFNNCSYSKCHSEQFLQHCMKQILIYGTNFLNTLYIIRSIAISVQRMGKMVRLLLCITLIFDHN